jgi:ATP-dependent RNA helicase DDX3X
MADQLNMNGLSLGDSQHANGTGGRSAYIPPHLRGVPQPPPNMEPSLPAVNGGMNQSAWAAPATYVSRNLHAQTQSNFYGH